MKLAARYVLMKYETVMSFVRIRLQHPIVGSYLVYLKYGGTQVTVGLPYIHTKYHNTN